MIIGEINAALAMLEKLWRWRDRQKKMDSPPVDSVATRFVRVFESHGVHRNQIPRFLGQGLGIADMRDDDALLNRLNEDILQATCKLFSIRREWLDGAEAQIHPEHDFYKQPEQFDDFLDELRNQNPEGRISGVLIAPDDGDWEARTLLILQEGVGCVGDKTIYRFHLCPNWAFTYWRARAYLKACVALAWRRNMYIHGIHMPNDRIEELAAGESLLGWGGEEIWALGRKSWDPEDMALSPEAFLKGVEAEKDNFGIISGLRLWLALDKKGLMECGFGSSARREFEAELAKLPAAPDEAPEQWI